MWVSLTDAAGLVTGVVIAASALVYYFATRPKHLYVSQKDLEKDLSGKIIMVTGSNSGIGLEMSIQFYKQGAQVIMTGRSPERLSAAKQEVLKSVGEVGNRPKPIVLITDFADFDQLKSAAKEFLTMNMKLDVLMSNAGTLIAGERQETKQGLEMHMGTNHFGKFLFIELIRNQIKKGGRICITSSNYVDQGPANVPGGVVKTKCDFEDLHWEKRAYETWSAYGQSKHANGLHAMHLAELLKKDEITVVHYHPGYVNTQLFEGLVARNAPKGMTESSTKNFSF
jgi:NAD(P)-dependent dehydrogenase (short-subunit alcohol dehydrogenase family)